MSFNDTGKFACTWKTKDALGLTALDVGIIKTVISNRQTSYGMYTKLSRRLYKDGRDEAVIALEFNIQQDCADKQLIMTQHTCSHHKTF